MGKYQEAIINYTRLLEIEPNNLCALADLASSKDEKM